MEKLIAVDKEVRVRCPQTGEQWVLTSIWEHPRVVSEDLSGYIDTKRFEDFDTLFEFCEDGCIRNAEPYLNWRKKPTVCVSDATLATKHFLMERNFKWFEVQVKYVHKPDWSMDYLRKNLPAEDFADLCKSRGWKIF